MPSWLCAEFAMCRVDPAPIGRTDMCCGRAFQCMIVRGKNVNLQYLVFKSSDLTACKRMIP